MSAPSRFILFGNGIASILSAPSATSTVPQQAALQVTTDKGGGTLYTVVTKTATPPTASQVIAGQNASGAAAAFAGNQAVAVAGVQNVSATGLTDGVASTYWAHFVHVIGNTRSAVSTTANFAVELVTNGTFDTASNWGEITGGSALTISGGQASCVVSANNRGMYQDVTWATDGLNFVVKFDLVSITGSTLQFQGRTVAGGLSGGASMVGTARSAPGSYTETVLAAGTTASIALRIAVATQTFVVDNVSIKRATV